MAVGAHTEEDHVEDGESSRVFGGEGFDELGFIFVGELFDVIQEGGVNFVDIFRRNLGLGEEFVINELVVGVFVVKGDSALVGEVDVPKRRIYAFRVI